MSDFVRFWAKQCAKGEPLKKKTTLTWITWMAFVGIVLSATLVLSYRISPAPKTYAFLHNIDRLGMAAASVLTGYIFSGDRAAGPSAPVFFDIVLILATGLQTALLGAVIGLALKSKNL